MNSLPRGDKASAESRDQKRDVGGRKGSASSSRLDGEQSPVLSDSHLKSPQGAGQPRRSPAGAQQLMSIFMRGSKNGGRHNLKVAFTHPDDREREVAYFARAQSNSSAGQLELRLTKRRLKLSLVSGWLQLSVPQ